MDNLPNTVSGHSDQVVKVSGAHPLIVDEDADKGKPDRPSRMTPVPEPIYYAPFTLPEPPFSVKFSIHGGAEFSETEGGQPTANQFLLRHKAEATRRLMENIVPFNVVDRHGMLSQFTDNEKALYAKRATGDALGIKFPGPEEDEEFAGFDVLSEKPIVILRIDMGCHNTEASALQLPSIRQPIHKNHLQTMKGSAQRWHVCVLGEHDEGKKIHISFHDGAFFITELLKKSGFFEKHPLK